MAQNFPKAKLLFIPHYLGSLRYFEKLIPYLNEKYELIFLFLPHTRKEFTQTMTEYCQAKNYRYLLMEKYQCPKAFKKIPILRTLLMFHNFQKQTSQTLQNQAPQKIISALDTGSFFYYFLVKANQKKIQTMVLQWALTTNQDLQKRKEKFPQQPKKIYSQLNNFLLNWLSGSWQAIDMLGGGSCQKFGVINQKTFQMFQQSGLPPAKMEIVGYIDCDLALRKKEFFAKNPPARTEAQKKYEIDSQKKTIIFFSTPFNIKDIHVFTDKEQENYCLSIISAIREIFPAREANLIFKPHPAQPIYFQKIMEDYQVKVCRWIDNEELINLADLFIDHHSSANFIPMALQKDIIFLNLLGLPQIERTQEFFGIKQFVKTQEELKEKLKAFKDGCLEKQYQAGQTNIISNSIEKIIKWIG